MLSPPAPRTPASRLPRVPPADGRLRGGRRAGAEGELTAAGGAGSTAESELRAVEGELPTAGELQEAEGSGRGEFRAAEGELPAVGELPAAVEGERAAGAMDGE